MTAKSTAAALKFIQFSNSSPSPFHCVDTIKKTLLQSGYQELLENQSWQLSRGGKYFYSRNQSCLAAFAVGKKFKAGNGFALMGTHTDSPNFVLKPISAVAQNGYLQVGVSTYGGGIWHTWFDRDLTVAGRAIVKKGDTFVSQLVHIKKPILRIPSLCIHFDREQNEKFVFNSETHLTPIIATSVRDQLEGGKKEGNHHSALVNLLAKELGCSPGDVHSFELSVCDTQSAALGGAYDEFVFAPRIDNQMSCFQAVEALTSSDDDVSASHVRALICFDDEEVGSTTAHGACSPMVSELLLRVTNAFAVDAVAKAQLDELNTLAIRRSFLISADMAHAVHAAYAEKHEGRHRPEINGGIVIKTNANQRYATTAITSFVVQELARRHNIPLQQFVVKNDSPCGSTIGNLIAANTGVRTVDVGAPQLAMHSIREMCGVESIDLGINLYRAFYNEYNEVDEIVQKMN